MAKFKFNLAPLLKVRTQAEEAAQRVLAGHESERVRLENMLRSQQMMLQDSSHAMRERLVGQLNVTELRLHATSALVGARDANRIVLELAGVHKQIDAARRELIEARKKRMAIERLRERRFEDWRARVNKAEDDLLDEIACRPRAGTMTEVSP